MRTVRSGARVTSGRKKKNNNERKDRRTNLFSPVQHAGQGKPAAFSIEEKQLQITLGQKSFLVRLAVSRDFLPPHSPYNGTGFVLSLYYQKSVIEYKEAEMLSTHYKTGCQLKTHAAVNAVRKCTGRYMRSRKFRFRNRHFTKNADAILPGWKH